MALNNQIANRNRQYNQYEYKIKHTTAHSWCDSYFIRISVCEVWG